jgi:hypothetical protein
MHYRSGSSVGSFVRAKARELLIKLEHMIEHNCSYTHSLYGQGFRSLYSVYEETNILGKVHRASQFGFYLEYVISQNILQDCLVYNIHLVAMVTDR